MFECILPLLHAVGIRNIILVIPLGRATLIKKKITFSSYIEKFRMEHAVAKSYMTNGLLIYGEIFAHFLLYQEALPHIYDFATAQLYISLYMRIIRFYCLSLYLYESCCALETSISQCLVQLKCLLKIKFNFVLVYTLYVVIIAKNKELLLKIFCGPFLPIFGKIQQKFGHKFFRTTFFSAAPFELFGQNFCHLATLHNIRAKVVDPSPVLSR